MLEGLFDCNYNHPRGLLAFDGKTPLQDRIDADPGPTVDLICFVRPGTRKISATRGSSSTFLTLSIRLLPRRSGISNVRPPSSIWTKPGLSPLGEQSSRGCFPSPG